MRFQVVLLLAVVFCAVLAGFAVAADPDKSTKVDGTFVLSKDEATFAGHVVDIRLYEFDPFLADVGATLIEKLEMKDFGHTKGTETKKEFVIGAKGEIKPRMSYYVTLFILKDGKRTHMGKVPGKFLCKVITGGNPRKIEMIVKAIGR